MIPLCSDPDRHSTGAYAMWWALPPDLFRLGSCSHPANDARLESQPRASSPAPARRSYLQLCILLLFTPSALDRRGCAIPAIPSPPHSSCDDNKMQCNLSTHKLTMILS